MTDKEQSPLMDADDLVFRKDGEPQGTAPQPGQPDDELSATALAQFQAGLATLAGSIDWAAPGSFDKCVRKLRGKEGIYDPEGLCAELHHRATGKWPGQHHAAVTAALGAPDEVPWAGMVAPYNVPTGDTANMKRMFRPGTIANRAVPFALFWQPQTGGGHDGAVIVGRVDHIDTEAPEGIYAAGVFFPESVVPEAGKAMYLLENGVVGPSVDLDDSAFEVFDADTGQPVSPDCGEMGACPVRQVFVPEQARVSGITLVGIPAFAEMGHSMALLRRDAPAAPAAPEDEYCGDCNWAMDFSWADLPYGPRVRAWDPSAAAKRLAQAGALADACLITLDGDRHSFPIADVVRGEVVVVPEAVFAAARELHGSRLPEDAKTAMRAALDKLLDGMSEHYDDEFTAPWNTPQAALVASVGGGIFTDVPARPAEAFRMKATGPTPVMITNEGQFWGHLGLWDVPHRGFAEQGKDVRVPRTKCQYREFLLGATRTTEGLIPTGKLVLGGGHADTKFSLAKARRWYDEHSAAVAEVNIVEDQWGPFMCGWLLPGVDGHMADEVFRNPPSGDWRWTNDVGGYELIAALGVNVPAFPVARVRVVNGQTFSVVGAGIPWELYQNAPPSPMLEEFDQIRAELDAAVGAARHNELSALLKEFA